MARLERRLARLDELEARLHADLAEHATDPQQVSRWTAGCGPSSRRRIR
jgi:hypothetical protein